MSTPNWEHIADRLAGQLRKHVPHATRLVEYDLAKEATTADLSIRPSPRVVSIICDQCRMPWSDHQPEDGQVTVLECLRLLREHQDALYDRIGDSGVSG